MPLTIPQTFPTRGDNSNYEPVPEDNHVGILIGVTDLGTHMESYQGKPPKPVRKVRLQWELPHVRRTDGTTATISASYNVSYYETSGFKQMLDSWLGTNWHTMLAGKGLEELIGKAGMVNVEQKPDRQDPKRTFSVITAVTKLPRGMSVPDPTRDTFHLDLDDKWLPAKLSLRDAEKIRASQEYQAGGFRDEARRPGDNPAGGDKPAAANNPIRGGAVPDAPLDDDSIPF